jgi:hypothetical protein
VLIPLLFFSIYFTNFASAQNNSSNAGGQFGGGGFYESPIGFGTRGGGGVTYYNERSMPIKGAKPKSEYRLYKNGQPYQKRLFDKKRTCRG